jgi:hypothetical protein
MKPINEREKILIDREKTILTEAKKYLKKQVCGSLSVTLFEIRSLADDLSSDYGETVTSRELIDAFEQIDNPNKRYTRPEPKARAGNMIRDFNGHEYKILVVCNEYQEISKYDSNAHYLDIVSDEQLEEDGIDPEDRLYCAVENEYGVPFVFPITRQSNILGE